MFSKIYSLLLFLFFVTPLFSQQDKTGNWLMYFGTNRIHDNWSIHTEVQYRNHEITPNTIEQLLLRTGLNYHLSSSSTLTAGYAFVPSYVYESEQKEPETTEHRIFQQLIMTNKIGRIKFEHRYRIEQRWVNDDYRNRLRYRLMAFIPINKPVIEEGTFFLGVYDEIFMNTEQTFFDRNRFYVVLGYQIKKQLQVQLGYLNQRVNPFGKHHLQLGVVFNTDFRK
jgi:hypothetical protein